ncbi:protein of unknown function [Cupriavidus taiwanensis]|uniref:Uncharacterized protein n=1 Tax=Cupriavidus taiwanensis TaxID=164546 RepID=A0A375ICZ4_9BURK|nr:protein of unknown function [Cupriavidus taiwanensis]
MKAIRTPPHRASNVDGEARLCLPTERPSKLINAGVFSEVETLIAAMDGKEKFQRTNFDAADFRVLREMVNDKNHSRVMECQIVANQSVYARGALGTVVMDKSQFSVPGNAVPSRSRHTGSRTERTFLTSACSRRGQQPS